MSCSIVLYDNAEWRRQLLPFSATRPVGNLRVGICTIDEKWRQIFGKEVGYLTLDYLQDAFPLINSDTTYNLIIKASVLPSDQLLEAIDRLSVGECLVKNGAWIAAKTEVLPVGIDITFSDLKRINVDFPIEEVCYPEDIYLHNKKQLLFDFNLLTKGRSTAKLSSSNMIFGEWIFVEEGAQVEGVSLNSLNGPIYIGKHANLEEGSFLRGYVGIGDSARVKMGSRLYENVSIGPQSTVGGEVNNSVLWGNSAKGHDGYLGCSVIGEGCNLGAGTSNSNLKNNWSTVKLYDYFSGGMRDTKLQKCGLMMGDYAMAAINSSFNTGSVIGVGAQIALSKFIPKFVPDFSWLTDKEYTDYKLDGFLNMLQRKQGSANSNHLKGYEIIRRVFKETESLRVQLINH